MLEVGQRVGSYRVIRLLGQGGMGAVFEAVHEEISRRVAIKVLHAQFASDPQVAQRFLNEARAVNLIEHPGLVTISDYGRLPDGTTFIVMELLQGQTIRARLEKPDGQPPLDVLSLTRHIASALSAAHKKGIVHRDLKPDNVMLVPDPDFPGGERVKILDFGIARVAPAGEATGHLTGTGAMLGTPVYMSPEQCRGIGQITDRADVYALGVMLFQLLAGRAPFVGQAGEIVAMHLMVEPPALKELRPDAPKELAALVKAMLSKEPTARPTMDAVIAELTSLGARTTQPGIRAAAPLPITAAGGISTLGSVAGQAQTGATGTQRTTSPLYAPRALLSFAALLLVMGATSVWFLKRGKAVQSGTSPAVSTDGRAVARGPAIEPALALRTLAEFHEARGSARYKLVEPAVWEAALADLERALKSESASAHYRAATALCRGRLHLLRGQKEPAFAALTEAIGLEPGWADAYVMEASAYAEAGHYDDAREAIQQAEALAPKWWLPVAVQGTTASSQNKLEEAVQAYRRALDLDPKNPGVLDSLSLALHAMHLDAESEAMAQQALSLDENLVGPHILRAELALERGDGKSALAEAGRAVSLAPRTPTAHLARADALLLLHQKPQAKLAYHRLLELIAEVGEKGLPETHLAEVRKAMAAGRLPATRKQTIARLQRRSDSAALQDAAAMRSRDATKGHAKPQRDDTIDPVF